MSFHSFPPLEQQSAFADVKFVVVHPSLVVGQGDPAGEHRLADATPERRPFGRHHTTVTIGIRVPHGYVIIMRQMWLGNFNPMNSQGVLRHGRFIATLITNRANYNFCSWRFGVMQWSTPRNCRRFSHTNGIGEQYIRSCVFTSIQFKSIRIHLQKAEHRWISSMQEGEIMLWISWIYPFVQYSNNNFVQYSNNNSLIILQTRYFYIPNYTWKYVCQI